MDYGRNAPQLDSEIDTIIDFNKNVIKMIRISLKFKIKLVVLIYTAIWINDDYYSQK